MGKAGSREHLEDLLGKFQIEVGKTEEMKGLLVLAHVAERDWKEAMTDGRSQEAVAELKGYRIGLVSAWTFLSGEPWPGDPDLDLSDYTLPPE